MFLYVFLWLVSPQNLYIHPTSILVNQTPDWLVFYEVVQTNKVSFLIPLTIPHLRITLLNSTSTQIFMREVSVIEPTWLAEIAPHFYQVETNWDRQQQMQQVQADQPPSKKHRSVF